MAPDVLAAYVAACLLLALTPGPNMALIIATTLARGLGAGLATIAGTTTGLAVIVAAATIGMSSLMVLMAEWFDVVRWLGAVYLAVLGALQLRTFWRKRRSVAADGAPLPLPASGAPPVALAHALALYAQGVGVSLSNPKALLFLGAFLPQFIDRARDPVPQLALIAVLFVAILAAVDIAYTLAVARARETVAPARLALLDGASGALLLAGGIALATLRRP